jgi:hypothetical protein
METYHTKPHEGSFFAFPLRVSTESRKRRCERSQKGTSANPHQLRAEVYGVAENYDIVSMFGRILAIKLLNKMQARELYGD